MQFFRRPLRLVVLFSLIASFAYGAAPKEPKYRVLIASPVRQKPTILTEFLGSLKRLEQSSFTADYLFVDDNDDQKSRDLLIKFSKGRKVKCNIMKAPEENKDNFLCNEQGHHWTNSLPWRVAESKDRIIEYARDNSYDYLFLIDSDILLHPVAIDFLIEKKKDIISNIFWTCWTPESMYLPQVWMKDHYTQYECEIGENLSEQEIKKRHFEFLSKMLTPDTYEVGGLGACTLISKNALNKGVSFKKLKNCSFWGEDRHFCLRAAALDLDLFVDTHYPAYHIFRESALSGVENFKQSCALSTRKDSHSKPRITLSMIMKNEAGNRLREMLENARRYITDAVIIDDASTDNSVAVCEEVLADIPHRIVKNKTSKFHNEIDLRTQQWEETAKTNPDWILFLDADEIMEDKFAVGIPQLTSMQSIDAYYFRLYDFWDENHYRQDQYWSAHQSYRPFLIRYRPDIPHVWLNQSAQHCGRMPSSCLKLVGVISNYRVKHYGWASPKIREAKYLRYARLDPDAKHGIKEQYDSILDDSPTLVKWVE